MPEENPPLDTDEGWQEYAPASHDEDEEGWDLVPEDVAPEETSDDGLQYFQSFDRRWRNEFEGLTYLGDLEGEVKIPYHSFTVRTLKTGEKIRVVELVKHLEESIGYARAYRAAVVAAGLVSVDGKPLLVGSKRVDVISQKYQYVIDNWYDYVIDILYDKINGLEGQVLQILKQLGVYDNRREVAQADDAEPTGPVQES